MRGQVPSIWDSPNTLAMLEEQRDERRRKAGRISFDCLNLKVRGDRVICAKGKLLGSSRDGSIALITVMRGVLLGSCRECSEFTKEEDNG